MLTESTGAPFSSEELKGKISVVHFFFTHCGDTCPVTSGNLKRVNREFASREDVQILSISIDPSDNEPAKLATYGKRYAPEGDGWRFFGGTSDVLTRIAEQFQVGSGAEISAHSPRAILVDREARIRGFYDARDSESIRALVADIHGLR